MKNGVDPRRVELQFYVSFPRSLSTTKSNLQAMRRNTGSLNVLKLPLFELIADEYTYV